MCTNVTHRVAIAGSAKGPHGWFTVDTATVYFDHPVHAPDEHTLNIDLVNEADGAPTRVAVELSAASARQLVRQIEAALADGADSASPGCRANTETPLGCASGVIGQSRRKVVPRPGLEPG